MNFTAMMTTNLDRANHLRSDQHYQAQAKVNPDSRWVTVSKGKVKLVNETILLEKPAAVSEDVVFLGLLEGNAVFAVQDDAESDTQPIRKLSGILSESEQAIAAYADGMFNWHRSARFCGYCGTKMQIESAGHLLRCLNPDESHLQYPRMDPAVIMTVTNQNSSQLLLGRSSAWPEGVYSTLAGFVEIGESLEQAVTREVLEETGINIIETCPVVSQPWPFPASIMHGFHAVAENMAITLDTDELEDARWFSREAIANFGQWGGSGDQLKLPRPDSIANHLIQQWLNA